MIARCLEEESEFGIVWLADDGLRPIGCACEIAEVLERMPDGRINLVARGTRPFRIEARQDELRLPGRRRRVPRRPRRGRSTPQAAAGAHGAYADLVEQATDHAPDPDEIDAMTRLRDGGDGRVRARRQAGPARPALGVRAPEARRAPVPRRDQAAGLHRPRPGPRAVQRQGPLHGLKRRPPPAGGVCIVLGAVAPCSSSSSRVRRRRVGGGVQRRVAALLVDVRVRARLQQRAHRRVVADRGTRSAAGARRTCSRRRRRPANPVARIARDRVRAAEERREVQRREAVAAADAQVRALQPSRRRPARPPRAGRRSRPPPAARRARPAGGGRAPAAARRRRARRARTPAPAARAAAPADRPR